MKFVTLLLTCSFSLAAIASEQNRSNAAASIFQPLSDNGNAQVIGSIASAATAAVAYLMHEKHATHYLKASLNYSMAKHEDKFTYWHSKPYASDHIHWHSGDGNQVAKQFFNTQMKYENHRYLASSIATGGVIAPASLAAVVFAYKAYRGHSFQSPRAYFAPFFKSLFGGALLGYAAPFSTDLIKVGVSTAGLNLEFQNSFRFLAAAGGLALYGWSVWDVAKNLKNRA